MTPESGYAWAAGFWDGEGCVVADKRTGAVTFQLSQSGDEAVALLERFQAWTGVSGKVYQRNDPRGSYLRKPAWKLYVHGEDVAVLLERCRPWLSDTKIRQADERFAAHAERQASFVSHWAARTHCKHGHEFTPENTFRRGTTRICLTCRRARGRAAYAAARKTKDKQA